MSKGNTGPLGPTGPGWDGGEVPYLELPQNPVATTYGNGQSAVPTSYIWQKVGDNDAWRIYGEAVATNNVRMIFQLEDDIETVNAGWIFRNKKTYGDFAATEPFAISGTGNVTAAGDLVLGGSIDIDGVTLSNSSGSLLWDGNTIYTNANIPNYALSVNGELADAQGDINLSFTAGDVGAAPATHLHDIDNITDLEDALASKMVRYVWAPKIVYWDLGGTNAGFRNILKVTSGTLSTGGILYVDGTTNSVVVNAKFEILVNHFQDIVVKSLSGGYTQVRIRVQSGNDDDFNVLMARDGNNTDETTLNAVFIPYDQNAAVTTYTTNPAVSYSSVTLTHQTIAFSENINATGGSTAKIHVEGTQVSLVGHQHAASDITSGTISTARLGSGTANSTTFLRGDNTWQTVVSVDNTVVRTSGNQTIDGNKTFSGQTIFNGQTQMNDDLYASYIEVGGEPVWHTGNLKPNNFFNFNTTRATTTTFTSRGQQTLSTGSYLITIIGSYNVTYGGVSYAPQFGIFFSDPLNVAIMGNVVIRNNINDGNAHIQTISAPSTLASAVSGSFVSGPFIPTNSSLNYPIYISARVTLTANRTIHFGSRVTSAGGGGGPQMNTNSTMIIEPL